MNITPDLAAKVLDADLVNIVNKVKDGGILSAAERQMLQNAAFPENERKQKRAMTLLLKYSAGGRLTATELQEIRDLHPSFTAEVVADDAPDETTAAPASPPQSAPSFALTPDASPASGDKGVSQAQLERWSQTYGIEHRQLRRYIARGIQVGEPCPLDDATKMPAWVEKHVERKRQTLVDNVAAAAAAARSREPKPAPAAEPTTTPAEPAPAPPPPTLDLTAPLDLATVGGVEGESVAFFRRIFGALKMQLEEAYLKGTEERITTLLRRINQVGESLRKHEVAAEARALRMGEYIERAEVINDTTQAINILALLREKRTERIRAELADLPTDIVERLLSVHDDQSRREEDILRNLASMKTPADVW